MARISPVSLTGNGELKTTRVSEAELRDRLEASRNHIAKRVAHARRASGRWGPARSAGRRPGGGGMGGPAAAARSGGKGLRPAPSRNSAASSRGRSSSCSRSAATTAGCAGSRSASKPSLSSAASSSTAIGKPSSALSTSDNASPPSSTLHHRVSGSLRPTSYVTLLEDGHEPICTQVEPGPPGPGARRAQGMVSDEPGPRKSSGKKPA